jgi:hypothetical protein
VLKVKPLLKFHVLLCDTHYLIKRVLENLHEDEKEIIYLDDHLLSIQSKPCMNLQKRN